MPGIRQQDGFFAGSAGIFGLDHTRHHRIPSAQLDTPTSPLLHSANQARLGFKESGLQDHRRRGLLESTVREETKPLIVGKSSAKDSRGEMIRAEETEQQPPARRGFQ